MRSIIIALLLLTSAASWGQEYVEEFHLTCGMAVGVYHPDRNVILAKWSQTFPSKVAAPADEPIFEFPVLPDMILRRELWRDPAKPGVEPEGAAEYKPGPTNPEGVRTGTREEQHARNKVHYDFWKERGCPVPAVPPNAGQMDREAGMWLHRKWEKMNTAFRRSQAGATPAAQP